MPLFEQSSSELTPTAPEYPRPPSAHDSDLLELAAELTRGVQYETTGHAARTVYRSPDLRVVLIVLRRRAELKEHSTGQPVSILTLTGSIRVALPERAIEQGVGGFVVIESGVAHDVTALADSAFLVSMPWSDQSDR